MVHGGPSLRLRRIRGRGRMMFGGRSFWRRPSNGVGGVGGMRATDQEECSDEEHGTENGPPEGQHLADSILPISPADGYLGSECVRRLGKWLGTMQKGQNEAQGRIERYM